MSSGEVGTAVAETTTSFEEARNYTRIYVVGVAFLASFFVVLAGYLEFSWSVLPGISAIGLVFFAAIGLFAQRYTLKLGNGLEVSAGFLADFLAAAILGPLAGGLVASLSVIPTFERGQGERTVFQASALLITGVATGIVYWYLITVLGDSWGFLVAGILAALAYQAVNFLVFAPVMWLRRSMSPAALFREAFQPFLPFHFFFLFISLALLYSFANLGALMFGLLLLPVLGLVYAFRVFSRERELARNLERFSLQIASGMITALDMKDNYTAHHSAAVANYAYDIAVHLDLPKRECNLAHLAGLLHDLGKISVPDQVLNSRGRPSEEEWEILQEHTSAGHKILTNMSEFEELGKIVLHHHERYDGDGYPHGIAGEEIPLVSRIVSVADCYSAMVTDRPYAPSRTPDAAERELRELKGRQFDPVVVDAFLTILSQANSSYRLGRQADFHVQFQKVRFLRDIA